jgi:hypothetical protein
LFINAVVNLREQLQADLKNVIFDTKGFAEAATYKPIGGAAKTVKGIFRENFADQMVAGARSKVSGSNPHFQCSQVDIPSTKSGDTLKLRGTTYYVLDLEIKSNTTVVLNLSTDQP